MCKKILDDLRGFGLGESDRSKPLRRTGELEAIAIEIVGIDPGIGRKCDVP